MNTYYYLVYSLLLTFIFGCTSKVGEELVADAQQSAENTVQDAADYEVEYLDTLTVMPEEEVALVRDPYNPTYTKEIDLLDTKLDIRFDWEKERVLGKANLTLKPWFYPIDAFTLDAKNFDIHSIKMNGRTLKYDYDSTRLEVKLDRTYTKAETIKIDIDYTAKPSERKEIGGSSAITSDKGLFFINADGKDPDKPKQIWTQGETENNSCWFPTIDKPNERTTQEISLTVADEYETLSNGKKVSSVKNSDGTRTDKYIQTQSHAPYLFMVTVGDFAVKSETWKGIPVEYFVEKPFAEYADDIFPYTPEMLTFFSDKLGYQYPWDKYSQVVVRDYVSGAMENTSAVIFGEFMQLSKGDLVDELTNEKIVAHEMMHHWFGDLVTCESWANLTLNEGFANYSEYLWLEHHRGKDEADAHWQEELEGYLNQALTTRHPLIHFGYDNKEDMFDAHSYNKGGMILHMLREQVGDEAFFASCQKYLKDNEYTEVEVDELRIAFEEITGRDLNWFFDQWFLGSGHPQLKVSTDFDATQKKVSMSVAQTQSPNDNIAVFKLPISVDIYRADGTKETFPITINEREQNFTFDVDFEPALINFDATKRLLAEITYEKPAAAYQFQFENAPTYFDRMEGLMNVMNNEGAESIKEQALKDPYHGIRLAFIEGYQPSEDMAPMYMDMALNDSHSSVRKTAWEILSFLGYAEAGDKAVERLDTEPSNLVKAGILTYLSSQNPEKAAEAVATLKDTKSAKILGSMAEIFAANSAVGELDFLIDKIDLIDGEDVFKYFGSMAGIGLGSGDPDAFGKVVNTLSSVGDATNSHSLWRRFGGMRTLVELSKLDVSQLTNITDPAKVEGFQKVISGIPAMIQTIKKNETNSQLMGIYEGL